MEALDSLADRLLAIVAPQDEALRRSRLAGEDLIDCYTFTSIAAERRIALPDDVLSALDELIAGADPPLDDIDYRDWRDDLAAIRNR